jgi:hypothetical protein
VGEIEPEAVTDDTHIGLKVTIILEGVENSFFGLALWKITARQLCPRSLVMETKRLNGRSRFI